MTVNKAREPARDDRREIWRLLDKLTPRRRLEFLAWACGQTDSPLPVKARQATGSANEAYMDLMALVFIYHLDLDAAGRRLERMVRRGE